MKEVIFEGAIRDIPELKIDESKFCEWECRFQTKMSHQRLQHQTTSRMLELLHMDLMGPMQVESMGGKRYDYVLIGDFSGYTWINFLREKSDAFEVLKDLY